MVERIRRFQALNNQIFSILTNQFSQYDEQEFDTNVREFAPPVHPKAAQKLLPRPDE